MQVEESWKQFLWKLIEDPPAQIVTLNILSSVFIKFLSGNVITLVSDHHCEAAHQPIKEPDNPLFNS